jgi:putative tricarboxylic transport membrane protein
LRRALVLTDGGIIPFFTRPISLILILFIIFTIVSRTTLFKILVSALAAKVQKVFRK